MTPLTVTFLGASSSTLSVRFATPSKVIPLRSEIDDDISTFNNLFELSVTVPISISVVSVGVT